VGVGVDPRVYHKSRPNKVESKQPLEALQWHFLGCVSKEKDIMVEDCLTS